ncbi:MAG: DUF1559 domain-containing protein [Verrucomicrobiae bacterium]|nr:DUF1559 domain-containing protein [Verrucomicrobiae bacterium]
MNSPSPLRHCQSHQGFTLIELLVVTAIIALLCAMLSPALKSARNSARSIACINNLKQISHAVLLYAGDHNDWLPHGGDANLPMASPNQTWKYLIAPYLGTPQSTHSLEHGIFQCPSQKNASCGNAGLGCIGFYGGYGWNDYYLGWRDEFDSGCAPWVNLAQINSPTHVIMVGDTSDYFVNNASWSWRVFYLFNWAAAGEGALTEAGRHNGGGNYAWVDGHVSWHAAEEVWAHRIEWFKP